MPITTGATRRSPQAVAAAAAAAASAATASAAADRAGALTANAAISNRSYSLLSELLDPSAVGTFAGESATVWNDSDENNGVYAWSGSAWVRKHDNPSQQIAALEAVLVPDFPGAANDGTIRLLTPDYWGIADLTPTAIQTLTAQLDWLIAVPPFIQMMPGDGHLVAMTPDYWGIKDFSADSSTTVAADTDTVGHVAEALGDSVGSQPFIAAAQAGLLTVGESKAGGISGKAAALAQIYTQLGLTLPSGATVVDGVYFHNAFTAEEVIADWAAVKAIIDAMFAAGCDYVYMLAFLEMANNMIAYTDPAEYEARILELKTMVQRYCLYKCKLTAGALPVPPVYIMMDCTWPKGVAGDLPTGIPLRAVEMSHRLWDFGVAGGDYMFDFYDDRHFGLTQSGDPGYDPTDIPYERSRVSAYFAIPAYWRAVLGRKYHPTQIIDSWVDGTDAFLEFHVPYPPLTVDTTMVSAIADYGLQAFTAAGAPITLSGIDIADNGRIMKLGRASPWTGDEDLWLAMTGTTPGKSGRDQGPRSTLVDSAPFAWDLGRGVIPFRSFALPTRRKLVS